MLDKVKLQRRAYGRSRVDPKCSDLVGEGRDGQKVECDRAGQKYSGAISIEEGEQFVLGEMMVVEMGWVICQKVMKNKIAY